MNFFKLCGVGAAAIIGTLAFGAVGGAGAVSTQPPIITVKPNNVMVNTKTTVTGRNFAPNSQVLVAECGKTLWSVPKHPCDTDNTLTVTTDANGDFAAPMKVEALPEGRLQAPDLRALLHRGAEAEWDRHHQPRPARPIIVTYP